YATDNSAYNGTITVYISAASTELGTITYEMRKGGYATLKKSDFTTAFANNGAGTLSYIKFNLPSSTYGYLNYNYTHSSGHYDYRVSSSTPYYLNESLYLEKVSFVPKTNYTGTVTIGYKAYNTSGNYYEGKVRFIVGTNSGQLDPVEYTINQGETVTFVNSDLNAVFEEMTDKNFSYVKFTSLPSSSQGALYYSYQVSGQTSVSTSREYYRNSSPYFREITFVPASGYTGTVDIRYTAFDSSDNGYTGTISIEVKETTQKTVNTLTYSIKNTDVLAFPVSYIESLVKNASSSGYGLSYVTVTPVVNAYGGLYYGYLNANNKGSLVTSASTKYYRNGDPSAARLYLVPNATYAGTFNLEYTAYDLGGTAYKGKIAITLPGSTQKPQQPQTPQQTGASQYFTDVTSNYSWASEAIDYLYIQNVVTGTGGNNYSPAANIKRGDFILMLYRAFDLKATTSGNFKDVPSSKYYAQAIAVAKALGIAKGGDDGKFNPEANLSRQDACVLLDRTLDVVKKSLPDGTSANLTALKDRTSISSYATGSVATLVKANVITGYTDKTFRPKGNLTRAEMAVILYRVLK
ncbi:MAG: S-layer homology domain-containing protein, partial [Firmicutes bacterium]|nr:S-layer homology domain-containing protein [Bacillota bacterium]